jgi:hypothetical protein
MNSGPSDNVPYGVILCSMDSRLFYALSDIKLRSSNITLRSSNITLRVAYNMCERGGTLSPM